ncbi:MAG: tetratricopeptide repeat protein [Alphaproteobacteria bacterium]|nr:MAG: tetratricopeptide repeat protein [Alphaproteobacteria bacterium]
MTASALAARLGQAMTLLQAGRTAEGEALCRQVLTTDPKQPDALHLLAMAARGRGAFAEAESLFRASLAAAPRQPAVLGNFGQMLGSLGHGDEAIGLYRQALAIDAGFINGWYNLALTLMDVGDAPEAVLAARQLVRLAPAMPTAWEALGLAEAKAGNLAAAQEAFRTGLGHAPAHGRLWAAYADLLRDAGAFAPAAVAYEKARMNGLHLPEIYRNLAECYYESQEADKALKVHDDAVGRFPHDPQTHYIRAKFRWETGQEGDHLARLRQAIAEKPAEPHLWGCYLDLLAHEGRFEDVLDGLGRAQKHCAIIPRLKLAEAVALSALGQASSATTSFEQLLQADTEGVPPRLAFAEHLIKTGMPERADALCEFAIARDPYDQRAWAFRGTAWEMTGDTRARWLLDYDRMVRPVTVEPPAGYADTAEFFAAVRGELEQLHRTEAHPLDQTLRGGTQTNGFLFRRKNALLQALRGQIDAAIKDVLADFPDEPGHPFWGRRQQGFAYKGAWSVRLRSQGFHTNHFHPEGWFSSALYIALPPEVGHGNTADGYIQFGVPPAEMGLNLAPARVVEPKVGTLVLFPSYMWHGTIPFTSAEPRITIAFDFVPIA